MHQALVVDDDRTVLQGLSQLIEREQYRVSTADNLALAREMIGHRRPDVVFCDLGLPDGSGMELVQELGPDPTIEIVPITGNATIGTAVDALRLGAYDYLTKPIDLARLKIILKNIRGNTELRLEVRELRQKLRSLGQFGPMVGTSKPMQEIYDLIEKVAPTSASVIVSGESGTGKELVAQAIHRLSRRKHAAFVAINCGAMSAQLVESELFGHERGSFTGASQRHRGCFERAHEGTLFLDEITEMPAQSQTKLLRVLETGEIMRVGGEEAIKVDVRFVAASNRDLLAAVTDGKLREDLFYRLNVFPIQLPPLRARIGDAELLAEAFLNNISARDAAAGHPDEHRAAGVLEGGRAHTSARLTPRALKVLEEHSWPGNVRELKNVIERAAILADDLVDIEHLPRELRHGQARLRGSEYAFRIGESVADVEKRLILATLEEHEGDKKKVAQILGISVKTLYNRLSLYRGDQ